MIFLLLGALISQAAGASQYMMSGIAWGPAGNWTQVVNQWAGVDMPVTMMYDTWCGYWIYDQMVSQWAVRAIPMFTFQPQDFNCAQQDPSNTVVSIANGEQDAYITYFFNQTKIWLAGPNGVYGDDDDRRMYMRFAHEMNGNWYPWTGNATAYVSAWQRVWNFAQKLGITNTRMQWVWCPNANDVGGIQAEAYYPGDQYVDWLAIDGYNDARSASWSQWQTPDQVFDDMVGRLTALAPGKPMSIPETGCSTSGETAAAKSQWISDVYAYAQAKNFKMIMWFNIEGGYTDFAIFDSRNGTDTYKSPITGQNYLCYDSYAQAVKSTAFALDPTNPRIITDAQFMGQF